MMYQQLMPDGSVLVNLGGRNGFMDEFMAEGAPHLRALYAQLAGESLKLTLTTRGEQVR
jgi:hypothetical protein